MATYNRAHFIVETLQSIQAQTYTHWECLIIDDGGSDNTEAAIKTILQNDIRFKFFKRTDTTYLKGLSGCRNYGLHIAKGHYIIFFDDDDIVHPQNLEICTRLLDINKSAYFCRYNKKSFEKKLDYNLIDGFNTINNRKSDSNLLGQMISGEEPFASCTVMWRKICFNGIRFNENLHYAEEWECYARILSFNFTGILIDDILYFNRKHPNSNTGEFWNGNKMRMQSKIEAAILVITNLEAKKLLDSGLIKYFSWESARLKSPVLFSHLMKQPSLKGAQRLKEQLRYYGSPLIRIILRIKKRLC